MATLPTVLDAWMDGWMALPRLIRCDDLMIDNDRSDLFDGNASDIDRRANLEQTSHSVWPQASQKRVASVNHNKRLEHQITRETHLKTCFPK